jgi:hypothetical protein
MTFPQIKYIIETQLTFELLEIMKLQVFKIKKDIGNKVTNWIHKENSNNGFL